MVQYVADVRFVIEADNMRDAFDSLGAFLAAVAPSAESYGIALVTPRFPEDIRYAAGEERGGSE